MKSAGFQPCDYGHAAGCEAKTSQASLHADNDHAFFEEADSQVTSFTTESSKF